MIPTILIGLPAIYMLVAAFSTAARRTRRPGEGAGELPQLEPARTGAGRPGGDQVDDGEAKARISQAGAAPTVSVVIPTLNEVESLPWVLENLPPWVSEVVLIDGLSTDRTEALARRLRPDAVVVHQHQRGKGAALRAGFAAATGDVVVMIDADGSTDPREMVGFVTALQDGADFVKGSRHMRGGGSADFTQMRAAGNKLFVLIANFLYGSRFTDLCYGYCAFWRHHLGALELTADGFEIETQLVLGAVKAGLEIREVPSFELERRAGASNLNAFRDGTRVLRTLLAHDLRRDEDAGRFTLRKVHLPVWSTDRVPVAGERRSVDRRIRDNQAYGNSLPERRRRENRQAIGTVVAYRAEYNHVPPEPTGLRARAPNEAISLRGR